MAQVAESKVLWKADDHAFVWLGAGDAEVEKGIASNQYAVLDGTRVMLLDPGGYHVFDRVLENVSRLAPLEAVTGLDLFFSHQDPDVCASLISWIEIRPDARVIVSWLWERFLLHFAVPALPNVLAVPDEEIDLPLPSGTALRVIPAHYLHSPGNLTLYDPAARILFSGDIGAALVPPDQWKPFVEDFEEHAEHMLGFHRRYMSSNKALRRWVERVRALDIDMICPQHGSIFRGEDARRFLDWLAALDVGVDAK